MLENSEDGVNVLIDFTQVVTVVRVLGNAVTPARLQIKAEVLPDAEAKDIDFDIAFAKIKFWFETIVSRTIIFGRNNTAALKMFTEDGGKPRVANQLMITPHHPTDEHLGALFQAKMTALSGGIMDFGAIRVQSESSSGLVWTYCGDWRDDLPEMEDWFNSKPYYFDRPWWSRNDISTIDMVAHGVTDFSTAPAWAFTLDFIEQAIRPAKTESDDKVVIRGKFRPKVIDGGAGSAEDR